MAYEYTTVTVDLTEGGSSGAAGTIYAELFHTVTLANNDTVAPQVYSATVTAGAATLTLPCTATALMNTNAPFLVTFVPTGGKRRTLGRIVTTESATAVQLADLLEVSGSSAVPVTSYNVDATNLTIAPSIAQLQAMRGLEDGNRVLVEDYGLYRYDDGAASTADEVTIVTPASAVGRWLLEIPANNWRVEFDARQYGYIGSGSDSSPAINAAITAANAAGGGVVRLPVGTIRCDTQIVLKDKTYLQGLGRGTLLDFSSAGAITDCIKAAGSAAATSVAFSATITKGDTTITFPSAPTSVAAGSLLLLYDTVDGGWNGARTYYRKGEWVKVKSVSGGTVTLDAPVFDTYASGSTTTAYLVTSITAGVRALRATFKSNLTGIKFQYGFNCAAEDLDLTGSDLAMVNFDRCFESRANNVRAFDVSASVGTNYGLIIGNSQRMIVSGCMLDTTRHGLAIGGGDFTGAVPNRDLLITGNIINGHTDSINGADIHGNAEFVTYSGNRILAGLTVAGDNITVADNDIRTSQGTSKNGVYASELLGPNIDIVNNRIVATGALNSGNSAGINFSKNSNAWQYAVRSGALRINGNTIDLGTYTGVAMHIRNGQTNDMLASVGTIDLDISNNHVRGTGNQTTRSLDVYGQVTGTADKGFKTVRVHGNSLYNCTLDVRAPGARTTSIVGNEVISASNTGISYAAGANYHGTYQTEEEVLIVEQNRVIRPNKCGIQLAASGGGTRSYLFVRDNTSISCIQGGTTGSTSTDSSLYASAWAVATIERNIFGKMPNDATSAQSRYWAANAITDLFERHNHNVGTVVTRNTTSVTNRHLDTFFPFNFSGVPGAAVIYTHVITRRCTIPATAPSSYAKAGTAATAATTFDIAVNGVAKGTFLWAIAGTVAAFTVASDVVLAPGDILTITTENPADGTLANIGGALAAYTY